MHKVSVPQADGEISITVSGDESHTWHVKDGHVEVAASVLPLFLAHVDNATVVSEGNGAHSAKPAVNKETKQNDGSPAPNSPPKLHGRKNRGPAK